MEKKRCLSFFIFSIFVVCLKAQTALDWSVSLYEKFHGSFDVYTNADSPGNHFVCKGKMASDGDLDAIKMDEACTTLPYQGTHCIQCTFVAKGNNNWGGIAFLNGVLEGHETTPKQNWGTYPNAGINLTGATEVTFFVRGEKGGEWVKFFCFGQGAGNPWPDSADYQSSEDIQLTTNWQQVKISFSNCDLSYIICGFGWATNSIVNPNGAVFYLDQIQFNKSTLTSPRFCLSYETTVSDNDIVLRNVAFLYDNAMFLLALLASKDYTRSALVADAIVYALEHDRYYEDGRVRNAYQAGDLWLPNGWVPNDKAHAARMPGWYSKDEWLEDKFQVSQHVGNLAWAMIALEAFYEIVGKNGPNGKKYLDAAIRMGEWIEKECKSNTLKRGYTAGFEGWEKPNGPKKRTYKATEHNIDLYAAFHRLFIITGDQKWENRAEHARFFVNCMWDAQEKKFWTGTEPDGETINTKVVPVDIQAWAILSLGKELSKPFIQALEYAEKRIKFGQGYDFSYIPGSPNDGIWYEGTCQMACAYFFIGKQNEWQTIVNFVKSNQYASGAIPAASIDGLTTGFDLPDGKPWLYFNRAHTGATSWYILALNGVNPFWLK